VMVIEPISSSSLECMATGEMRGDGAGNSKRKAASGLRQHNVNPAGSLLHCACAGAKTSFKLATGLTLAEAAARDTASLPEAFAQGVFCDNYSERCVGGSKGAACCTLLNECPCFNWLPASTMQWPKQHSAARPSLSAC
jgi:hypothetical protein